KKDDPTPNAGDVTAPAETTKPPEGPKPAPPTPPVRVTRPPVVPVVPLAPAGPSTDVVEVFARVPHVRTSVRVTIDVNPGAGPGQVVRKRHDREQGGQSPDREEESEPSGAALGGGRRLPKLLFVTSREGLVHNIGRHEADEALQLITDAGQDLFD